ncbi:alpha-L-fucosidase [Sphingobacterium anhuiense]|uniref:alpha-L-fucosidase n=1 Tax=Sphingobacterium anhuiense TaxID=493780 RepID=A0ABW5YZH8_9SPHI
MDIKYIIYIISFFGLIEKGFSQELQQHSTKNWEDFRKDYKVPKWFADAKFGIWVHWGAQTQPKQGGGWYARNMYQQDVGKELWGKNAYPYHNKTYGHPSKIGYKDVVNEWKADSLDTDALLKYFKSLGAKYFVALANHHDHFDNFESTYNPWNSVNVGPKRDIISEFEKSTRKYQLPFGVSSHDDRFLSWWLPAFGADKEGAYKDIPYDGRLTKEDGKGLWWEGLDPADLYGLPPEMRDEAYLVSVKEAWVKRTVELATKYDVDMLWFDGYGFPYGNYGKKASEAFYNFKLEKYGKLDAIVAGKFKDEPSTVMDVERGGANSIQNLPWQGTLTFTSWFYKEDRQILHNARTVVEMLVDMISKNGNLLLNVELLPNGKIPNNHRLILDSIGAWVNMNAEAIYASKPWTIYGDNLQGNRKGNGLAETDLDGAKKQNNDTDFNERTIKSSMYPADEVRFTCKGKNLYIFVMNPKEKNILIPSLALQKSQRRISKINLLGSKEKIHFDQNQNGLTINLPNKLPTELVIVFKIEGLTNYMLN